MDKEITSSDDISSVIEENIIPTTYTTMSNGTVVIGDKAFDLAYANDPVNVSEITSAIVAGGIVYVKDFDGDWIDNVTGKMVDRSIIPAVLYKSANIDINFDAADRKQD